MINIMNQSTRYHWNEPKWTFNTINPHLPRHELNHPEISEWDDVLPQYELNRLEERVLELHRLQEWKACMSCHSMNLITWRTLWSCHSTNSIAWRMFVSTTDRTKSPGEFHLTISCCILSSLLHAILAQYKLNCLQDRHSSRFVAMFIEVFFQCTIPGTFIHHALSLHQNPLIPSYFFVLYQHLVF